jgi:hypothetical protein
MLVEECYTKYSYTCNIPPADLLVSDHNKSHCHIKTYQNRSNLCHQRSKPIKWLVKEQVIHPVVEDKHDDCQGIRITLADFPNHYAYNASNHSSQQPHEKSIKKC